jgi:hypothetical protein
MQRQRRERGSERALRGGGALAGWRVGGCLSPGTRMQGGGGGGEERDKGVVQNACDGHERGGWDGTRPVLSSLGEITQGYCSGKHKANPDRGGTRAQRTPLTAPYSLPHKAKKKKRCHRGAVVLCLMPNDRPSVALWRDRGASQDTRPPSLAAVTRHDGHDPRRRRGPFLRACIAARQRGRAQGADKTDHSALSVTLTQPVARSNQGVHSRWRTGKKHPG